MEKGILWENNGRKERDRDKRAYFSLLLLIAKWEKECEMLLKRKQWCYMIYGVKNFKTEMAAIIGKPSLHMVPVWVRCKFLALNWCYFSFFLRSLILTQTEWEQRFFPYFSHQVYFVIISPSSQKKHCTLYYLTHHRRHNSIFQSILLKFLNF